MFYQSFSSQNGTGLSSPVIECASCLMSFLKTELFDDGDPYQIETSLFNLSMQINGLVSMAGTGTSVMKELRLASWKIRKLKENLLTIALET